MTGKSFGSQFTLIEVVTDRSETQRWVAAAGPDQAITLVLCAVPEGCTATVTDEPLTPEEEASLNLKPGEVRELKADVAEKGPRH